MILHQGQGSVEATAYHFKRFPTDEPWKPAVHM